jgi:hypothetical protein
MDDDGALTLSARRTRREDGLVEVYLRPTGEQHQRVLLSRSFPSGKHQRDIVAALLSCWRDDGNHLYIDGWDIDPTLAQTIFREVFLYRPRPGWVRRFLGGWPDSTSFCARVENQEQVGRILERYSHERLLTRVFRETQDVEAIALYPKWDRGEIPEAVEWPSEVLAPIRLMWASEEGHGLTLWAREDDFRPIWEKIRFVIREHGGHLEPDVPS